MRVSLHPMLRGSILLAVFATVGLIATTRSAAASLIWNWSYSGPGIAAIGTLTTDDTPDGSGYYLITAITGTRNAETITGLQPTGTAIPGNEPFTVDNLISLNTRQLTVHGFGYSTSGGHYSNPFFADFLSPPAYLEFYSMPSPPPGSNTELPVSFSASLAAVPAPATYALLVCGLGLIGLAACRRQALV